MLAKTRFRRRGPKDTGADAAHLAFLRECPCVVCARRPAEAAHVRYASAAHGKRITGAGRKPADSYAVPLCPHHHRLGDDAQHNTGERDWWESWGIDPIALSAELWRASGDHDAANAILGRYRSCPF